MDNFKYKNKNVNKNAMEEPSTSGLNNGSNASATSSGLQLSTCNTKEQEIDDLIRKAEALCITSKGKGKVKPKTEADLMSQLQNAVAVMLAVAKESQGISGRSRRTLQVAASSIMDAGLRLVTRTFAEDAALVTEVTELQKDIAEFSNSLQQPVTPPASCNNAVPSVISQPEYNIPVENTICDPVLSVTSEGLNVFESNEWIDLRIWRMLNITKEEVIAAIAQKGGIPPELVICSDIIKYGKPGHEMDSVFVTLPKAVAEAVAAGLELIVSDYIVLIKILPPKPPRCSNCMEAGHNRSECFSVLDCSGQCFRCSHKGHRAADCVNPPCCVLCTEAGKPSDHSVGDRACTAPSEIKFNR